jgi:hypothetical protein
LLELILFQAPSSQSQTLLDIALGGMYSGDLKINKVSFCFAERFEIKD